MNRLASHINTWLSIFYILLIWDFVIWFQNVWTPIPASCFYIREESHSPEPHHALLVPFFSPSYPEYVPGYLRCFLWSGFWFLLFTLFTTSSPLRGVVYNQHVGVVHINNEMVSWPSLNFLVKPPHLIYFTKHEGKSQRTINV